MAKKPTNKELLQEILSEVKDVKDRLSVLESEEQEALADEERELEELERLEKLEEEIEADVTPKPLARITYRDVTKGVLGAFVGIVGHFAFFYGHKIAKDLSLGRAHALLATSLGILVLFIYFSGFRKISEKHRFKYVPVRVLTIYLTAHVVVAFVLFLFGQVTLETSAVEVYKNVAAVSVLAVMGSATADLIGGAE